MYRAVKLIRPALQKVTTSSSVDAWQQLHGLINVYKPLGISNAQMINIVTTKLCQDLNSMEPPASVPKVMINQDEHKEFNIEVVPNLAEHELVTGPRYMPKDFRCATPIHHGTHTSGVMIVGINGGLRTSYRLMNGSPLVTYELHGLFGKQTETNFAGSRITARATYNHINAGKINALLSNMQATYQRQMYEMAGVDIQSQAAYELACQGPMRPALRDTPVMYSMKCTRIAGPFFTIEVQAMNAKETDLATLVNQVALSLRSVAHCQRIRCKSYGFYTFEDSLLRRQINIQNVLDNMQLCRNILRNNPSMVQEEVTNPVGVIEQPKEQ